MFDKRKKIVSLLIMSVLIMWSFSTVLATPSIEEEYEYISTHEIVVKCNAAKGTYDKVATIDTYDNNGQKIYKMNFEGTVEEKIAAFKAFNNFMESGKAEDTIVSVTQTDTEFYGNEYDSQANNTAGYTWAKYYVYGGQGRDKAWGGSSGTFSGSSGFGYIQLNQTGSVYVSGASTTLTVSWPPGISFTNYVSSSTGTWSSAIEYDDQTLGAQHPTMNIYDSDLQGGVITSFKYYDVADIKVYSTIYRPATCVRFTNGL